MPQPVTYPQFHEAIGRAVTTWGRVEEAFCDLFTRLVICSVTGKGVLIADRKASWVLGSVFHSARNLRSKIDLIDKIMRMLIEDGALLAEWESIRDKNRTLYSKRNVMAHGQIWGNEFAECIRYPLDAGKMQLSYQEVFGATQAFTKYEERITALAISANQFLADRH